MFGRRMSWLALLLFTGAAADFSGALAGEHLSPVTPPATGSRRSQHRVSGYETRTFQPQRAPDSCNMAGGSPRVTLLHASSGPVTH